MDYANHPYWRIYAGYFRQELFYMFLKTYVTEKWEATVLRLRCLASKVQNSAKYSEKSCSAVVLSNFGPVSMTENMQRPREKNAFIME